MAKPVICIGRSGSGKSSSIRGLDPKTTTIISTLGKDLPFPGADQMYQETGFSDGRPANYIRVSTADLAEKMLNTIATSEKAKHITTIVVDDTTFTMGNEFMARINEDSWDKWKDMAAHVFNMIQLCQTLRKDLVVVFMWHDEVEKTGDVLGSASVRKAKTLGKLFDDKLMGIEPLFNMVLFTHVNPNEKDPSKKYYFVTQNPGNTTAKSPQGMFGKLLIPNDLGYVRRRIDEYYKEGKVEVWDVEENSKAYEQLKQSAF